MANWATTQANKNWSLTAADPNSPWYGGGNPVSGIPANLDNVTINHNTYFDTSQSGFANGLASLVLNNGAKLIASETPGTYYLKLRCSPSANAAGSEICAGSAVADYPFAAKFSIYINGNYSINCLNNNLLLKLYCYKPIIRYATLISSTSKSITAIDTGVATKIYCSSHGYSTGNDIYLHKINGIPFLNRAYFKVDTYDMDWLTLKYPDSGLPVDSTGWGTYTTGGLLCPKIAEAGGSAVLDIDEDVSIDPYWVNGSIIRIANNNKSFQWEERTIQSVSSTSVTMTSGLSNEKFSGSLVAMVNRNVMILGSTTSTTNGLVYSGNGHYIDAMIKHGYSYSTMVNKVVNSDIKGIFVYGASGSIGGTCYAGNYNRISAIFMGIMSGINNSIGDIVLSEAVFAGCYGVSNYTKSLVFDGLAIGGSVGIQNDYGSIFKIFISGFTYPLWTTKNISLVGAIVRNNSYGFIDSSGNISDDSLIAGNTADYYQANSLTIKDAHVAPFGLSVSGQDICYDIINAIFIKIEDFLGVVGSTRIWVYGGTIADAAVGEPDFGLGITYTLTAMASTGAPVCKDYPIFMVDGARVRVKVYMQKDSTSWVTTPKFEIFKKLDDPLLTLKDVLYTQIIPDDLEEHYYEMAFTAPETAEYVLRISGKNSSGKFFFAVGTEIISSELALLEDIQKYHRNRKLVNRDDNTLTVFDDDKITPLKIFDLKNADGDPAWQNIMEFDPQ